VCPVRNETVNNRDAAEVDELYDCYIAAETHERPWHTAFTRRELGVKLTPTKGVERVALAARSAEQIVGLATISFPLLDNRTLAEFEVLVHPDHWVEGVGEALLAAIERESRARTRTTMMAWLSYALDSEPARDPHVALLLNNGFSQTMTEYQQALDLPVDVDAATAPAGYALRTFEGRPPTDLALGLRAMESSFLQEAPSGVELEAAVFDDETEDERWRRQAIMRRTSLTTVATSEGGEVVAYTTLNIPLDDDWAFQDDTLVARDHRGHGLGMTIKKANLDTLQRSYPDKRSVRTWNAGDNRWMVDINTELGFRPVEAMAELVKRLD